MYRYIYLCIECGSIKDLIMNKLKVVHMAARTGNIISYNTTHLSLSLSLALSPHTHIMSLDAVLAEVKVKMEEPERL